MLPRWVRTVAPWPLPVAGMLLGATYGVVEHLLDARLESGPQALAILHDIVEYLLPVLLGGLAGVVVNYARRQSRLNAVLSTQNSKLQRQFFTQTLSAHILHEIRNPLHNLRAVIESWRPQMAEEEAVMLRRNLSRLALVADQLSRWNALDESVDLKAPTPLRPWLQDFLADKVRPQTASSDIIVESRVEPVTVRMHPLLLEQCFVTLFANALEAAARGQPPRIIVLSARAHPDQPGMAEVELRNSGLRYPDAVLATQGSAPAESAQGLGLGLVLVRRALEQAEGSLRLENREGQACTTLWIPGSRG